MNDYLFSQFIGPGVCSGICTGNKTTFEECTAANPNTTCAKSPFGSSTHCFVAVGKYKTQIKTGIETGIGYISGCIDCTGEPSTSRRLYSTHNVVMLQ